jgi:hypothetical protein
MSLKRNYHESRTQIACVQWFRYQFPRYAKLLIAVPNGGNRNAREAKILKDEGVTPGVADLLLLVPKKGYGCLCIEMKTEKGSQSDSQKIWQKHSEAYGNKYVICRNLDEFIKIIEWYLT